MDFGQSDIFLTVLISVSEQVNSSLWHFIVAKVKPSRAVIRICVACYI